MTLHPVKSSQIHSVGHCPKTNRLHVCFHNKDKSGPGDTYEYQNVDADTHKSMTSGSVGSFFHRNIKNNKEKYPYKKL